MFYGIGYPSSDILITSWCLQCRKQKAILIRLFLWRTWLGLPFGFTKQPASLFGRATPPEPERCLFGEAERQTSEARPNKPHYRVAQSMN